MVSDRGDGKSSKEDGLQTQNSAPQATAVALSGAGPVKIACIRLDGDTQTRAGLNMLTVQEYADAMTDGVEFPAIVLYHDGADYWPADGFHRIAARLKIGFEDIDADVRQGDRKAAIWHALGANQSHGLRLTNADKRHSVEMALKEFPRRSDTDLSHRCGVSQPMVSARRAELATSNNGYEIAKREVTRNGVTYLQDTAKIGKRPEPPPTREPVLHIDLTDPAGPVVTGDTDYLLQRSTWLPQASEEESPELFDASRMAVIEFPTKRREPLAESEMTPEQYVNSRPITIAGKAMLQLHIVRQIFEKAGGVEGILRDFEEEPMARMLLESWLSQSQKTSALLRDLEEGIGDRLGVRRVAP